MNTIKTPLIAGLAAATACVVAAVIIVVRQNPAEDPAIPPASPRVLAAAEQPSALEANSPEAAKPRVPVSSATQSPATPAAPPAQSAEAAASAPPVKAPYKPGPSKFKKAREPMARVALEFVGADADAEGVWLAAINDPTVPADERKDLIEDLNEDGISDPRNPTRKDLALIQSRIALIEQILPGTTDRVNADAFREAHKDLVNMNARLTGK